MNTIDQQSRMEAIVSLCKRRGFIFPSSEIYGGFSGVYDYGHYGTLLLNNVKEAWKKNIAQERMDVFLLDSAIFMHPTAWKASGHVDGFNDPQIDCRKCKSRFRADHVLEEFDINADKQPLSFINEELNKLRSEKKLVCSGCGSADLTEAKVFSLMVKSNLGSPTDALSEDSVVYLRPETCGGIYLEYKNTIDSIHPKLPFGIAQIGKAFRNEIVAKQFVFRTREFEQMEMQYFHHPSQTSSLFEAWHKDRWAFYREYGIPESKLNWHKHDKLAHYASDAYDIEYNYAMLGGFKEMEGVHARGDWDLTQHSKFSGQDLSYFEESTKERFVPHIVETSVGVARMTLAFIDNAYTEEEVNGETRVVLKFDKRLAPVKVAILPLSKKEELSNPAKEIWKTLSKYFFVEYDDTQSIGKRYRRQDEIGTPYCVTVDFDTLTDNAVTVRDRDTMEQIRVPISDLKEYFVKNLAF
ncbi:MAG: glycine--tRNA ligase [Candidatus Pacebacteria bacterium]|nr:glycine--tRNA ligase [Candidatus Paceibacterota bacterium]MBP9866864.1 glycine--tRNA ligase [Candidatus Paceibacterota bacterium]